MSEEMKSLNSDEEGDDMSEHMDDSDDESFIGYYDETDDLDIDKPKKTDDPEYFEYELLQIEGVDRLLNEEIEALCTALRVWFSHIYNSILKPIWELIIKVGYFRCFKI